MRTIKQVAGGVAFAAFWKKQDNMTAATDGYSPGLSDIGKQIGLSAVQVAKCFRPGCERQQFTQRRKLWTAEQLDRSGMRIYLWCKLFGDDMEPYDYDEIEPCKRWGIEDDRNVMTSWPHGVKTLIVLGKGREN